MPRLILAVITALSLTLQPLAAQGECKCCARAADDSAPGGTCTTGCCGQPQETASCCGIRDSAESDQVAGGSGCSHDCYCSLDATTDEAITPPLVVFPAKVHALPASWPAHSQPARITMARLAQPSSPHANRRQALLCVWRN